MTLGQLEKTKKHEHGVVAALDVEVPPPSRTPRSSLRPSVCTVAWFAIAATFAGLFGWAYCGSDATTACDKGEYWVFGDFDDACHQVGDRGLYAIPGKECPSECDTLWHSRHPADRRRLAGDATKKKAKLVC